MDTKWKKFSYSKAAKVISFLLACVFVAGAALCACNAFDLYDENMYAVDDAIFAGRDYDLETTYSFAGQYEFDVRWIMLQALYFKDGSDKTFEKSCKKEIDARVNSEINSLKQLNGTDSEVGFNSEYFTKKYVGSGYFGYDSYGHSHIFDEDGNVFIKSGGADGIFVENNNVYEYTINKEKIRENTEKSVYETFRGTKQANDRRIEKIKNLKYAVINKTDNKIYTNIDGINSKSTSADIRKTFSAYAWNLSTDSEGNRKWSDKIESFVSHERHSVNMLYEVDWNSAGLYQQSTPIKAISAIETGIKYYLGQQSGYWNISPTEDSFEVYIAFDNTLAQPDAYSVMRSDIENTRRQLKTDIIVFAFCALFILLCTIHLIVTAGRKEKNGEVKLAAIDRIFNFIHFAVAAGLVGLAVYSFGYIIIGLNGTSIENSIGKTFLDLASASIAVLGYAVFVEWVMSFSRHIKNKTLFKHTAVCYVIKKIRQFKENRIEKMLVVGSKKAFISVAIASVVYLFALCLLSFLTVDWDDAFVLFIIFLNLLLVAFVVYSMYHIAKIMKVAEEAKNGRFLNIINLKKTPFYLRKLAQDVMLMQSGMKTAIESAVRDQKMKTELITNVSHDLKTPLTAIINYVDLLGKCEIEDSTANEYIVILEEKSARLKKLIEDLTEAAKASSGNIAVNAVKVNLNEFAIQIAGEMNDELERKNLSLVVNTKPDAVLVMADSKLVSRILENLMSNVRKYAMPGTRVYINVGDEGSISISNVSNNPIEVSAEELKGRFVRGDKSRTTDGSGLGLSIAEDLCRIQGGELNILIEGDLFKVTVILPKASVPPTFDSLFSK